MKSAKQAAKELELREAARSEWPIDVENLTACTRDACDAAMEGDAGPADPTVYAQLRTRLETARDTLPPLYRGAVYDPYVATLDRLGERGFQRVLLQDPDRESAAGLLLDIAHAILQNGESYQQLATDAFEEVVSDLYDGFLSAEDRRGVKEPDKGVIAPLVKWGQPDFGPYTWPVDATQSFGVKAPIVSLPPANARRAVVAWAALAHETAGHDILGADKGLAAEIADRVRQGVVQAGLEPWLADYWADRIDETASDAMGILNTGPAAGIGLVAYFRGLNQAWGAGPKLRNVGPESDPHPADIVRGYLAAEVVARLRFRNAEKWAKVVREQTDRDLGEILLAGRAVRPEDAKRSADIVAETLVNTKLDALERHALGDVQSWYDHDELAVTRLRTYLTTTRKMPKTYAAGLYAAHVVAAAVMASLAGGADAEVVFQRMLVLLKAMHDGNPSWGPLYVAHPGNLAARRSYVPATEE